MTATLQRDGEGATLQITGLKVHFPGRGGAPVRAVDGISLSIDPGETLGLVGESGCGKSTVSNATVGLIAPTAGSVRVLGTELAGADARTLRAVRARAQMVFQDPVTSLNPRMTVGAAIGEPLLVRRLAAGAALRARVAELLQEVGLRPEHAGRYPHQFSGGQRQRIVIARALALRPALLVCDEPVSALDVSVRAQILNLLVDLQARHGMSSLFVSHDLAVVRHVCDRVAVMYLGRIAELAPRDALFAAPRHPLHAGAAGRGAGARPGGAAGKGEAEAGGRDPEPRQSAAGLPLPHPLPDRGGPVQDRGAGVAAGGRKHGCLPPGRVAAAAYRQWPPTHTQRPARLAQWPCTHWLPRPGLT